jgi:hypothetical protein
VNRDDSLTTEADLQASRSLRRRASFKVDDVTWEQIRLSRYIEPGENGCWEWGGCRTTIITVKKGLVERGMWGKTPAYRLTYEWVKGPIPEGYVVDHLCRNPNCVNPSHLEAVTNEENIRRGDHSKVLKETCDVCGELRKIIESNYTYRGKTKRALRTECPNRKKHDRERKRKC